MVTANKKNKFPTYGKWLISIAILAVLALGAYHFLKPKPTPPEYLTAKAVMGDIEQTIMATGKVKAINSVDVGARVSGEITHLYVDVGSEVKKGDIIAQISEVEQKNTVSNAKATRDQAQASLAQAQSTQLNNQGNIKTAQAALTARMGELQKAQKALERMQELIAIDAVSRQEYEDAKTNVQVATANVESAQATLQNAKNDLNSANANIKSQQATIAKAENDLSTAEEKLRYTTITAPMDGVVVSVTQKQGTTVNAMQSAPTIVTLADLSRVRINAKISEADVVNVSTGMPARFNIIGNPDKKYDTLLAGVEPAPEKISTTSSTDSAVYYIGYLDVDNTEGKFRIDMTAQINIITNAVKNVLTIPSAALNTDNGKHTVKVVGEDGFAKPVPVTIGLNNRVNVEIKSGLSEGDTVVIGEAGDKTNNRNRPPMI